MQFCGDQVTSNMPCFLPRLLVYIVIQLACIIKPIKFNLLIVSLPMSLHKHFDVRRTARRAARRARDRRTSYLQIDTGNLMKLDVQKS